MVWIIVTVYAIGYIYTLCASLRVHDAGFNFLLCIAWPAFLPFVFSARGLDGLPGPIKRLSESRLFDWWEG
jgi:hypothetical protein